MQELIISITEHYGYIGILFLMLIENIFPPIPSEVVLGFGGFMTTYTELTVINIILVSTVGVLIGAAILYWIGTKMDEASLKAFIDRHGGKVRISYQSIDKALSAYKKHETKAVFFCRMIPGLRSLISIPAGMARMKFQRFLLFTGAGTLIWNTLLVSVSAYLGSRWYAILDFLSTYSFVTYIVIGLILVYIFYRLFIKKKNTEI